MEVALSKYTNPIVSWANRTFVVDNDELKYKSSKDKEKFTNVFHLDLVKFCLLPNDELTIIVQTKEKDLTITSNNPVDLYFFCDFLNHSKYSYILNQRHFEFNHGEMYRFNTKEFKINLNLY